MCSSLNTFLETVAFNVPWSPLYSCWMALEWSACTKCETQFKTWLASVSHLFDVTLCASMCFSFEAFFVFPTVSRQSLLFVTADWGSRGPFSYFVTTCCSCVKIWWSFAVWPMQMQIWQTRFLLSGSRMFHC